MPPLQHRLWHCQKSQSPYNTIQSINQSINLYALTKAYRAWLSQDIILWSRLRCRAWEPEPGVFGSLEPEPEPLEKKTRSRSLRRLEKKSGAGAAKKLAGSSALREDKKNKEIVLATLL